MKSNRLFLFLVVLFAFVLISSAGRTLDTTFQSQNEKPKGDDVVKAEKVVQPDKAAGCCGCWRCWPPKRGRRL
ncbi:hypothetical protein Ccrd_014243 [Cynara cardunculus var. scolymus]|uniref:Uncharacterized protein n=1 Tax=Cynara cardunculus var. scolymus TaxID=59895 RepID=A0A124SGU1_CYNCS|nr:hypothetical protein Ccrd_014243 [Cynara cardunculus var. scolymus]